MSAAESGRTYGGEVEMLAVESETGKLRGIGHDFLETIEKASLTHDTKGNPPNFGYDSSQHLLEIRLGIHANLRELVRASIESVKSLQEALSKQEITLVSTSYHPFEDPTEAYQRVLSKPIYDLIRGAYGELGIHPNVLRLVYGMNYEHGRGWNHESGTLAVATQPWNSLEPSSAAQQIAVLQSTGFVFNLLLANSPFARGERTDKRDYRLEMWGENGLTATSRYKSDIHLTENLPEEPRGLVDYFAHVLGNQRPLVIPNRVKKNVEGTEYKASFMAVVQPPEDQIFTILDYLEADSVKTVDIETGNEVAVTPSVGHIVNDFDFLYFPRYGVRLRVNLPFAEKIDPKEFAQAIRDGNEIKLQKLLEVAGISKGGFICAEGRVSATVLPTIQHPDWKRHAIVYVLQTALVRSYEPVGDLLHKSGLTWKELSRDLPDLTNRQSQGFEAEIRGVNARDLAKKVWNVAEKSLSEEERSLVGDEIDAILNLKCAPAEEQINKVEKILLDNPSLSAALLTLIQDLGMVIPPDA